LIVRQHVRAAAAVQPEISCKTDPRPVLDLEMGTDRAQATGLEMGTDRAQATDLAMETDRAQATDLEMVTDHRMPVTDLETDPQRLDAHRGTVRDNGHLVQDHLDTVRRDNARQDIGLQGIAHLDLGTYRLTAVGIGEGIPTIDTVGTTTTEIGGHLRLLVH
jgi:hypothetical protein